MSLVLEIKVEYKEPIINILIVMMVFVVGGTISFYLY